MGGQLITAPGFKTIGFSVVDPTLSDKTQSGKYNVRKLAAWYFTFSLQWPRLKKSEMRPIFAQLLAQRGMFDTFTVVLPEISTPDGVATGAPLVKGAGQSGTDLIVDGFTASVNGILKALDVFVLAGHSKVYQLATDADSDATGTVTLQLIAPLLATPADNEALTITDVPFTVRRVRDPIETNLSSGLYDLEQDLVEDIT